MPVFAQTFHEITAVLGVSALLGALALWLRQPLIVAFMAVGLLVGPAGLGWVQTRDQIDLLAKIGIALLLFVVGLKLDLHVIRTMGSVALATGLGQVLFTSVAGYGMALALGLSSLAAVYVAVALTFSSTIIIVKLLSDKKEIDALHGRIAVGFLIVQDIVVVLVMIGLTAFSAAAEPATLRTELLLTLLKGFLFLGVIGLCMRFVLSGLLTRLAVSPELLMLFAIAWAVALASVGESLGFSKEVGAFLSGVALASTPYRDAIGTRLVSLRDFLLLFFFIDLGAQLDLGLLGGQLGTALVFSLFVLIGNPLIVMVIMGLMGYRKRTGFLAGLTVAQISEFSLILGALGVSLGHIDTNTMGLITLVGLVTIGLSTYMILYSHILYDWLAPWLRVFERQVPYREQQLGQPVDALPRQVQVIVYGLGRYGSNLARTLQHYGINVLGVDFDPQVVTQWRQQGFVGKYGDAEDPEFPAALPLQQAQWVVSTIPQRDISLGLLRALRQHGFPGKIAATAHDAYAAEHLQQAGADMVLLPFIDAAKEAANVLMASSRS
jgi:Kef-type K+ transport system membrane component KefB